MNEEKNVRAKALLTEAASRLRAESGAQQIVAGESLSGNRVFFTIRDWRETQPEEDFLRCLRESGDTRLALLACIWQDGLRQELSPERQGSWQPGLDLPSIRLRRALLALDAGNADTRLILNGERDGEAVLSLRRLETTLP